MQCHSRAEGDRIHKSIHQFVIHAKARIWTTTDSFCQLYRNTFSYTLLYIITYKPRNPCISGCFSFLARTLLYTDCSENFRTANSKPQQRSQKWQSHSYSSASSAPSSHSPTKTNPLSKRRLSHDPIPPHPRRNRRRHHNLQKPQRHLQQLNNPNKGINHEPNRNLRRRNRRTHLPHLQKQITTNKGDYYDTDHRIRYRSIRTLRIPQKITLDFSKGITSWPKSKTSHSPPQNSSNTSSTTAKNRPKQA